MRSPNAAVFQSVVNQIERNGHRYAYPNSGPLYGEPIYPGNGYPPNPGENRPGLSPWGRLAMGQTLGKSSIPRVTENRVQPPTDLPSKLAPIASQQSSMT